MVLNKILGDNAGTGSHFGPQILEGAAAFLPIQLMMVDAGNLVCDQVCNIGIELLDIHQNGPVLLSKGSHLGGGKYFNAEKLQHLQGVGFLHLVFVDDHRFNTPLSQQVLQSETGGQGIGIRYIMGLNEDLVRSLFQEIRQSIQFSHVDLLV